MRNGKKKISTAVLQLPKSELRRILGATGGKATATTGMHIGDGTAVLLSTPGAIPICVGIANVSSSGNGTIALDSIAKLTKAVPLADRRLVQANAMEHAEVPDTASDMHDVLSRGWSRKMAEDYLPKAWATRGFPDVLIEAYENTIDVIDELIEHAEAEKRRKRDRDRAIANEKMLTRQQIDAAIESIRVEKIPDDALVGNAIASEKRILAAHGKNPAKADRANEATIRRWVVNYIRHELSNYDEVLAAMRGRPGMEREYYRFQNRIIQRIISTYPEYAQECRRQLKIGAYA